MEAQIPSALKFRVALYPENGRHICQGLYRDVCTQGQTIDEAKARWRMVTRWELTGVPTVVSPDTPPHVRFMAENMFGAILETIEVEL